jgi:FKBP-type peptidyl-prolyl cis-trans isomerase
MGKLEKLEVIDTLVGDGKEAERGKYVEVHYTGKLIETGVVFDSSIPRGQTFKFPLGAGMVIRGWDEGVPGMKEGGKRTLNIPAALAYGSRGAGAAIGPDSDLTFDVELIKVL